MLDLTEVQQLIANNAPLVKQVILPENVNISGVDPIQEMLGVVSPLLSDRVYSLLLKKDTTYPAAAYKYEGSERVDEDGYPVIRIDDFQIAVFDRSHSGAYGAAKTVRDAIFGYAQSADAGSGEAELLGSDFNTDLELYQADIQVSLAHLAASSQQLPAVFVYPTAEAWLDAGGIQCVQGQVESKFTVLFVAVIPATGVSGLKPLRDQILLSIVSEKPTGWGDIEPDGGGRVVRVYSNIVVWKDDFTALAQRQFS